jgi:hypothetical protein
MSIAKVEPAGQRNEQRCLNCSHTVLLHFMHHTVSRLVRKTTVQEGNVLAIAPPAIVFQLVKRLRQVPQSPFCRRHRVRVNCAGGAHSMLFAHSIQFGSPVARPQVGHNPMRSRTDDKTSEQLSRRYHVTARSIVICSRLSRDRPLLALRN